MELIYRYDPYQPITWSPPKDAEAALDILTRGNARFVEIVDRMHRATLGEDVESPMVIPVNPLTLGLPMWRTARPDQTPFGLVVGCSDARVPIEQVFDLAFNSLFVVRIAGNVLGTECLGSVDFAVRNLANTLKFVLVLGHSGCGAVTAAVDTYLNPGVFSNIASTHALRSLVDRLMVAVRGADKMLREVAGSDVSRHPDYRTALVELSVYCNAAVTAYDLVRETAVVGLPDLRVVYAVYDFETLLVHTEPEASNRGTPHLSKPFANAPRQAEEFVALVRKLAERVVAAQLTK